MPNFSRQLTEAEADVLRALVAGVDMRQPKRGGDFTTRSKSVSYALGVIDSLAVRRLVTVMLGLDARRVVKITALGREAFAQYGR